MNTQTLKNGFTELKALAQHEYHKSLQELIQDSNPQDSAVRVGRLVGVMLKEPFATSELLSEPTYRTSAYRTWHLVDANEFDKPEKTVTWQYQTLEQIRRELATDSPRYEKMSVYELAQDAEYETGFFGYFARTISKYICRDPEIRKKVEDAIKAASEGNNKIFIVTPEYIVGTSGLAFGVFLVNTIPILGFVGAPVIAAVVVILYTLGVDAFCNWSAYLRTDEDEK
ncbi:hypothetical protein [Nostoc sp.]